MESYIVSPQGYVFKEDGILTAAGLFELRSHGCDLYQYECPELLQAIADSHGVSLHEASTDDVSCGFTVKDGEIYFTEPSGETFQVDDLIDTVLSWGL